MPIRRVFPGLAAVSGVMLVWNAASGTWSWDGTGDHAWPVLATLMTVLLSHGLAVAALRGAGRRVRGLDLAGRDWPGAQSTRNQSRAWPFAVVGAALAALAAVLAIWAGGSAGQRVAASAALSFNLGAFVLEWASIRAQFRLLAEVKGRPGPGEDRR